MRIVKKIDSFEKNTIYIFVTMIFANVCSYGFQIYTGRRLTLDEYGILNTCISLLNVIIIPGAFLSIVSSKYTTEAITKNDEANGKRTINAILFILLILLVLMGGSYTLLAKTISKICSISNINYVFICVITSLVVLISSTLAGIIQGMQKYKEYGVQEILINFGKLTICIFLGIAGWRLKGALFAILFSYLLTMIYCIWVIREYICLSFSLVKEYSKIICGWIKEVIGISLIRISYLFLLSVDVILVNIFFSEEQTGVYSSAMVVSKIGLYLSGAILVPLFPMVVERKVKGIETKSILLKAILYGEGMSLAYSIFLNFTKYYLIVLFFGEKYEKALDIIPYTCFYVCGLTFFTIIMNYAMAIDEMKVFGICSFVNIFIIIVVTFLNHKDMKTLVLEMGTLLWIFSLICFLILGKKKKITV